MSEPTLGLTFLDMQIRVAEYLGIAYYGTTGREVAQLPSDAHDLDLVGRIVNDGYRRFLTENPKWQFLTPLFTLSLVAPTVASTTTAAGTTTTAVDTATTTYTLATGDVIRFLSGAAIGQFATISAYNSGTKTYTFSALTVAPGTGASYEIAPSQCVQGDAGRYYLPDGFYGSLVDPLTYDRNSGYSPIMQVDEQAVRVAWSAAETTGTPQYVAFRPMAAVATTSGKRWEAIFWPRPSASYTVTGRARLFPDKLVNATDRHICGFQHDEVVLNAALAEAEKQRGDRQGFQLANYDRTLQKALRMDREAAPKRRGYVTENSDDGGGAGGRSWFNGVDTYGGNAV